MPGENNDVQSVQIGFKIINDKKDGLSACMIKQYLLDCIGNDSDKAKTYQTALWIASVNCLENKVVAPTEVPFVDGNLKYPSASPRFFHGIHFIKPVEHDALIRRYRGCMQSEKRNIQACFKILQSNEEELRGVRLSGK